MGNENNEIPVQQRIVHHTQGWGVLGEGVAAHLAHTEPMEMRIAHTRYDSGLGTHAPSETTVLLGGLFQEYSSDIGAQHQPEGFGTIVFRVIADGEEIFTSEVMSSDTPPQRIALDVQGVLELRLIVDDAGDGTSHNLANWANPVLKRNPETPMAQRETGVNMAPFARWVSWDPNRTTGTQASRLETMPEEDIFAEQEVICGEDGVYEVPVYAEGRGCIGLEWLERRRVFRLEIEFDEAPVDLGEIRAEFWRMVCKDGTPGGSRWQGSWLPLTGMRVFDGQTVVLFPEWEALTESLSGVLKVRFILPASAQPARVRDIRAYTMTKWKQGEIILQADAAGALKDARLSVYNGTIVESGGDAIDRRWDMRQPVRFTVTYSPARPWELGDRTVLRFAAGETRFGVAMDDVMQAGPVFVEHAGVLISPSTDTRTVTEYRTDMADKQTVLERVRAMPDQTVEQAMRYVYRPEADRGPTMLSLATDNRKYLVAREGEITWDIEPSVFNHYEDQSVPAYSCMMHPTFGNGAHDSVTRHYQRDWLPVQLLTVVNQGLEYRQRTFVAPYGKNDMGGTIPWIQYRALGVADFRIVNEGTEARRMRLALRFMANRAAEKPATVRREGDYLVALRDDTLLAAVHLTDLKDLDLAVEAGDIRITGTIEGWNQAGCVVYIPHWQNPTLEQLRQSPGPDLLAHQAQAYWERILESGMQIEVPDDLIQNLIPASAMHCMLAARNENGERIAPWIGAVHYGPLESEAHSILRGMGALGYDDFVRRGLEYYTTRINEKGFLTTGYTVMGTGWHLWTLGEYYQVAGEPEWLAQLAPEIERACRWIMRERCKTKKLDIQGNKVPEFGLMPPGAMADWAPFAYYFYLNGYYAAGLREASRALLDINWPGAEAMLEDAKAYEEDIRQSFTWVQGLAPVHALQDGTSVPYYPTHVYSPSPIEDFYPGDDTGRSWCYDIELGAHHLVPFGILDAHDPATQWMMNHKEDAQFLRPGWFYYENEEANHADWFNLGGFAKVQPYYARTGEVYALSDEIKPFIRNYFNSIMSLLNREDLSLWEHFLNGAFNKTHETGYLLHQSRLMLVQERDEELWLAPFVTYNWLRDGMRVGVRQAPTLFGQTAFTLTSHVADGYMDAWITPPQDSTPKQIVIRMRHPESLSMQRAEVNGAEQFTIDPDDSTVHIKPGTEPIALRVWYGNERQSSTTPISSALRG